MTPEEVAEKFADARSGFSLASYAEVGLPYWRIRVRAVILERKSVGPIDEFILRCVAEGVDEDREIAALLGLDQPVVDTTALELVGGGHMRLRVEGEGPTSASLELTDSGRALLAGLMDVTAEVTTVYVNFDGLLREPVGYVGDWFEPRELRQLGLREIPPSPARGPNIDDLRPHIPAIGQVIAQQLRRHQELQDVLAIKTIDR